ncbi:acyltransferase [Paludibacterium yongneupense]|nr:acyltransferase [Paludibacterium yongneupense]
MQAFIQRWKALRNGAWISLGATLEIEPGGVLKVGRGVRIIRGSLVTVQKGAELVLEDGVWIGPYNIIYCAEHIHIGRNTRISHFCSIVDNNYDFRAGEDYFTAPKKTGGISIGRNSWLGAGSTVLRGVTIGEYCVLGANTLLQRGSLPAGTLCARTPDENRYSRIFAD